MDSDISPWRSESGRRALHNWVLLLARGDGDLADFARDVAAGRVAPQDLLYSSYLSDQTVASVHDAVDAWHALPDAEQQAAIANAEAVREAEIAALAALDPGDPPPPTQAAPRAEDDDYDFDAGFMKRDW